MLADPHPSVEARFGLLGGGEDVCYCFCQLGKQGDPVKHLVLEERGRGFRVSVAVWCEYLKVWKLWEVEWPHLD